MFVAAAIFALGPWATARGSGPESQHSVFQASNRRDKSLVASVTWFYNLYTIQTCTNGHVHRSGRFLPRAGPAGAGTDTKFQHFGHLDIKMRVFMHLKHIFIALRHARAQNLPKDIFATAAIFDPGPWANNGPGPNHSVRYSGHLIIEATCTQPRHAIGH
jgi:hypothetical protein